MGIARVLIVFALFATPIAGNEHQTATPAKPAALGTTLAKGVTYERRALRTPAGEPWSVHVLRVSRTARDVQIRAASAPGEMRRALPTEIARQEVKPGEELLAVVNGDYDIATPFLGVSDGLSITSGYLWTTGKLTWPALGLRKNGEPLIGVPQVKLELKIGARRLHVGAMNKPLGSVHGFGPRVYTREFRERVTSAQPFRAVVIGDLSRYRPLRANENVRGRILKVEEGSNNVEVPEDAIVVAQRLDSCPPVGIPASFCAVPFSVGTRVEVHFEVSLAGRRDIPHVIGGFPIIAQNGRPTIVGEPSANLALRHPRTAVCYNPREIVFVVVDGRQAQLSVGMTLEELGDLMVSLGCSEAMNTDGGGSSVMAVTLPPTESATTATSGARQAASLRIVNSPSDGKERGRGNAWVILKRK